MRPRRPLLGTHRDAHRASHAAGVRPLAEPDLYDNVVCVLDDGTHVMPAGELTGSQEQLVALRADAVAPDPRVHRERLETALAHCAEHPMLFLPSHDPQSPARLAVCATVPA